jgi:hypothetical protein
MDTLEQAIAQTRTTFTVAAATNDHDANANWERFGRHRVTRLIPQPGRRCSRRCAAGSPRTCQTWPIAYGHRLLFFFLGFALVASGAPRLTNLATHTYASGVG